MTDRARAETGPRPPLPAGVPAPWEPRFPEATAAPERGEALAAAIAVAGLAAVGVAVLVVDGDRVGAAVAAGAAVLAVAVAVALRKMRRKVAAEAERNPLVASYRLLVGMLAKVMAADRTLDRRERDAVRAVCDSLRISRSLRDRFIDEALDAERVGRARGRDDLAGLAARYLALTDRAGLPHARRTAMMAALAVARADGVVADAEEAAIRALAAALGVAEAETASLLAQHRLGPDAADMTPELARVVLGLGEGATAEQVEAACDALLDDLRRDDYEHVGQSLAAYAAERRAIVERARRALHRESAGDSSPR